MRANFPLPIGNLPASTAEESQQFSYEFDAVEARSNMVGQVKGLVDAYRLNGYRQARVDALGLLEPHLVEELEPSYHGLDESDITGELFTNLAGMQGFVDLGTLVKRLKSIYCGPLGLDCEHIREKSRKKWLWDRMESHAGLAGLTFDQRNGILRRLVAAEAWEHYLNKHHASKKRFSLEGCESLIPLLDSLIRQYRRRHVSEIVMGMAHRGRLNVLVNVLGTRASDLLSLIEGPRAAVTWDLNYHLGGRTLADTEYGQVSLFLAHNPSHLESIAPVVCGMARARQDQRRDPFGKQAASLLIHGDAAFSGQGVVMETLNLSQTRGYGTGGTVHVIINNQIGFTTSDPKDIRSTPYCTDAARIIDAPVLHVNADFPDHVVFAAQLAVEYRMEFGSDFVIDLSGFRRQGHSEQDIAELTQPRMHKHIAAHPGVVSKYARELFSNPNEREEKIAQLSRDYLGLLHARDEVVGIARATREPINKPAFQSSLWDGPVATSVPLPRLQSMIQRMTKLPDDFTSHPEEQRMARQWRQAVEKLDREVDWRLAENLAYASLLANGYAIRLSGLDVGRGTFYQRHAVWRDQLHEGREEVTYIPLRHVADEQGTFDLFDSPLAENAILAFEYGYSVQRESGLVIWEAQYGDFVNGAQVVIDQYISTGEEKWEYHSGLVVMLPHGDEGVGPEHSSAYLGRFLNLCADKNLRVVAPSTSAQLFHVLRRQALVDQRKPLILMTPKSWLYGDPQSHSRLEDLVNGKFQPLVSDAAPASRMRVERVVVTSGKFYYDLLTEQSRTHSDRVVIIRLEQLYPFPQTAIMRELSRFPRMREIVWAQEEAKNHGAWHFVRDRLEPLLPIGVRLSYVGRKPAAPSATCSVAADHVAEQEKLAATAMSLQ